ERRGVSNVGAPAEQEGVDVLHEAEEGGTDVVVPVGAGPAAVGEAAIGVFVFAAGRLHDAVQGDEFVYDELSHCRIPCVRGLGDATPVRRMGEGRIDKGSGGGVGCGIIRVLKDRLG